MLLFLVLAIKSDEFEVTCSYSSHQFLCALDRSGGVCKCAFSRIPRPNFSCSPADSLKNRSAPFQQDCAMGYKVCG